MSKFLNDWIKFLKLKSSNYLEFNNADFKIKIYSGTISERRVRVYDITEKYRLDNYDSHVFFKIPEKDVEINLNDDKYLSLLLLRIVADFPDFYKRKEELEYFDICKKGKFSLATNNNFSIEDCEVFLFWSRTEEKFYRAGRDNRFEITSIETWYIKYQKAIIVNNYLQSLLPPSEVVNETEYVYASTAIGGESKTFSKDETQTKLLRDNFSMDSFLSSFNEIN